MCMACLCIAAQNMAYLQKIIRAVAQSNKVKCSALVTALVHTLLHEHCMNVAAQHRTPINTCYVIHNTNENS